MAVDSEDAAYVVGESESSPVKLLDQVGYVMKFDSAGQILYTKYIGAGLISNGIAVDGSGNIHLSLFQILSGGSASGCGGPIDPSTLTVYNPDASRVVTSAFWPGTAYAMALDGQSGAYVLGFRSSPSPAFAVVKFDLTQDSGPYVDCVVNAANLSPGHGFLAPGEIISFFGEGFTPGPDLEVTFNGKPAPILYSDTRQINTVVPFEAANTGGLIAMRTGTRTISPFNMPVLPVVPGLFIISGTRQIVALNQDGSVNSVFNAAAAGSVVSIYMNGAGTLTPALRDGQLGPVTPPFSVPSAGDVSATIYSDVPGALSSTMPVLFAGQAPGQIAGLVQINLRIPDNVPDGKLYIEIAVGSFYRTSGQEFIQVRAE